jgi:regulator of protease activity HflC (stomatin/prohibitin superfamily)
MLRETRSSSLPGLVMLLALLAAAAASIAGLVGHLHGAEHAMRKPEPAVILALLSALGLSLVALRGLFVVNPNEGVVMQLFGRYAGTERRHGLRWTNPFYSRSRISLRVRNFESAKLKVNDLDGNPIEIATVVVWRVADTAEAAFNVDSYTNYVHVQSEAALRNLATQFPYDAHEEHQVALRSHTNEIAERIKTEVQARLEQAGVSVIEARITHLAYAPEIAQAMLQRQQAGAIIAARTRIVEGAVGMVEMALHRLAANGTLDLDEERKAAMVSNLLVVLCGERAVQPVVNSGTLYAG